MDGPSKVSQVLRLYLRFFCFTKQQTGSLKSCQVSKSDFFLIVFSSFSLSPSTTTPTLFFYPSPPLQIPSAGQLMEAVRVKMKERKVLTEELATLTTPVSEKAWLPGLRLEKLSSSSFSPSLPPSLPVFYSVGAGLNQAEPGQQNQYLWEKRCRLTLGHWRNTAAQLL